VYVDEQACIGCTLCAGAAPATFFMEESFGRARVYQQQGDAAPVIQNAIDLCPVRDYLEMPPSFFFLTYNNDFLLV